MIKANPLPTDGVVGKLTPAQDEKLRKMWKVFYELVDDAPEEGDAALQASGGRKTEGSPKDVPKDDAEKERVKAQQEKENAMVAVRQFGRRGFMDGFWKIVATDDPDYITLRFLRARKWDPSAGCAMMASCVKWRLEFGVDKIVEKGEEGMTNEEGFIKQQQEGKTYTHGTDRSGRPVTYINAALHFQKAQPVQAMENFTIFNMEAVRCLLVPPADKVSIVFNMKGFSYKNMDWGSLMFLIRSLEAYYPESLNCIIFHDAPWVAQGIWKMLGPLLDPVVRAKVQFTKDANELFVHMPERNLIKQLGGKTAFEWDYKPVVPGENAMQEETAVVESLNKRRLELIAAYDEINRKYANGSTDKDVLAVRKLLANTMRMHGFKIEAFTRGRTYYHRKNICGNGLVFNEYAQDDGVDVWAVAGDDLSFEVLRSNIIAEANELEAAGIKIPELIRECIKIEL